MWSRRKLGIAFHHEFVDWPVNEVLFGLVADPVSQGGLVGLEGSFISGRFVDSRPP